MGWDDLRKTSQSLIYERTPTTTRTTTMTAIQDRRSVGWLPLTSANDMLGFLANVGQLGMIRGIIETRTQAHCLEKQRRKAKKTDGGGDGIIHESSPGS